MAGEPGCATDGTPGGRPTRLGRAQRGDSAQVEAFPEPPRVPTPVHRPDGRLYRPRKLPAAMLLGYDEIEGVCVMRTHSLETATSLALAVLRQYDNAWPWELSNARCEWGHWRPAGRESGERAWARDETGLTGQAAVFFDVEQA